MKVVINDRHGGFGLSAEGMAVYLKFKNSNQVCFSHEIARNDPALIQVVETMGERASDSYSRLKVVEIPDDVKWQIAEYDGMEWIAETHRTWR